MPELDGFVADVPQPVLPVVQQRKSKNLQTVLLMILLKGTPGILGTCGHPQIDGDSRGQPHVVSTA